MATESRKVGLTAWTDYPITALGDRGGKVAPVREVRVVGWDRNKYAYVRPICAPDLLVSFKACYLYTSCGCLGDVPHVSADALEALPYPPESCCE